MGAYPSKDFSKQLMLMNLATTKGTNIKEFDAKAGSETMMDFNNGDPLANTKINDMHMHKGSSVDFSGATGEQELGVMDQFEKGSSKRAMDALKNGTTDQKGSTMDDQWATIDTRTKSMEKAFAENIPKVVLLI